MENSQNKPPITFKLSELIFRYVSFVVIFALLNWLHAIGSTGILQIVLFSLVFFFIDTVTSTVMAEQIAYNKDKHYNPAY